jgi:antitoxin component YwqK of YwqJK toxin-antitoxin module
MFITLRKQKLQGMRLNTILGCMLFCIASLQASAQVDSMQIDGEYYKIYPYPEQIVSHDDYWLAVNDKEYFENPENFFQLFGETEGFNRSKFEGATGLKLERMQNRLKSKWKNLRSKNGRFGFGKRFVKQVRMHPYLFIGPKYLFNKEVLPPFGAIPDGKYVQLFTEFCLVNKKGECVPQTQRVAGYFDVKNNAIDGKAFWMNVAGDTLKRGEFKNGLKHGEWSMIKIDRAPRSLYGFETKSFRKYGKFYSTDTLTLVSNYKNGIQHGDYFQYGHQEKTKITGEYINGEKAGNWKTYKGKNLLLNVTYSDPKSELISHKPIIRTGFFFSGDPIEFKFYGYKYGLKELPSDFYKLGFEEEPDIELEEEGFKSHRLEYYGGYENDNLPERFKKIENLKNMHGFYDFHKDPRTKLVETRGYFIDSVGAKMLYDGLYEVFYPNGQLFTRYTFDNGELTDEGTVYWDNGVVHDEIVFVPDSNRFIRRAYDYEGVLFETAIYDSLGDFVKTDKPAETEPSLFIDGITAELIPGPEYGAKKFQKIFPGNYAYKNWDFLKEQTFTDETVTLFKMWSGVDTTVIRELTYDPKTRKMVNYNLSYTGKEYWRAERVFTEDYGSWTGKTQWKYGNFEVITTASGILKEMDNDTLPQLHLKYYSSDYDVTSDVEVLHKGKPYNGKVKVIQNAPRFRSFKNKLTFHNDNGSAQRIIERQLLGYLKRGTHKNSRYLELVGSVDDCEYAALNIQNRLFEVVEDGYFSSIGNNNYYGRSYVSGYVTDIKGKMVEGKAQGTWKGKNISGRLISEIAFDRGDPIGLHSKYGFHSKIKKEARAFSEDSLPSKKIYFLYSTELYDKGMLNGPMNQFNWHGEVQEKGTYLDGLREGEFLSRYSMAYSKSNYKYGRLDGYSKTYLTLPRKDTVLLYDLNFSSGYLNGKSVTYHTNGNISKQGFFLDGEPIDDYEAFDTLGFKYHYIKFKYSLPVEEKIWEENELSLRYTFDWEDSIRFDPSDITNSMSLDRLMYQLGYGASRLSEEYYGRPRLIDKSGLAYHMTKYYPNDTIARDGQIDDGKKTGYWKFFDYEGEFLYDVNYFDSIITVNDSIMFKSKGVLTDYDKDGKKLYEAFILEKMEKYDCAHTDHYEIRQLYTTWEADESLGRMNGFVQNFYDNGVLQNEGTMKDGLPQGLWKYYDPFGKLNLMGMFHQGKRDGRWLSGDLAEKKYLGEICLNPNLPNLEEEKKIRENLLDVTIINYQLGKALNKQFYDLNLNKYSNLKTN